MNGEDLRGHMAGRKKNGKNGREEEKVTSEYYRLKTQAVKDLAEANEENSPEVSEKELDKYRSGPKFRVADWVKALLLKIWFAGAVCFFVFWGLSMYITASLDILFIFGMALGIVTDLMTNNVLRFIAKTEGANDRWMMFPKKRYASFFFNIIYAVLLLFCVMFLYNLINYALIGGAGTADTVPLSVEPVLFGVFYTAFDVLFLEMKQLCGRILRDAKEKAARV